MSDALRSEIKSAIVRSLRLPMQPEEIGDSTPLFGEGLGLDSIDMLEIALAITQRYGFQLRSDDPENKQIFGSLRSLSNHVALKRVK